MWDISKYSIMISSVEEHLRYFYGEVLPFVYCHQREFFLKGDRLVTFKDYFKDPFKPTTEERVLFELETGLPAPGVDILVEMAYNGSIEIQENSFQTYVCVYTGD